MNLLGSYIQISEAYSAIGFMYVCQIWYLIRMGNSLILNLYKDDVAFLSLLSVSFRCVLRLHLLSIVTPKYL